MPEQQSRKKKSWLNKIRLKYRLKILHEENYEEKASFRLSILNVSVILGTLIMIMVIITIYLAAFTSLREFIPGYADTETKQRIYDLVEKTDSLEKIVAERDVYLENLALVLRGEEPVDSFSFARDTTKDYSGIRNQKSGKDEKLRDYVNSEDQYNINPQLTKSIKNTLSNFLFYSPLAGQVVEHFKPETKHYGVDIVSAKNEGVKAVLTGTVVFTGWTSETGYVIVLQHLDNLISIYKHNSSLLKKEGSVVRSGEPIAIVGNSGELTTGPHLHFEMWFNGRPIDPEDVIDF